MSIESGSNYWDGQQWTPSDARFDISPEGDAFVADRVQHRTRLAANINEPGAVTVSMPDGTVLRSTPVAIGLYNAVSGESVILAGTQDCVGMLVNDNQVVYQDAFNVHLLEAGHAIRTVQELLGHKDVSTTQIHTSAFFLLPSAFSRVASKVAMKGCIWNVAVPEAGAPRCLRYGP